MTSNKLGDERILIALGLKFNPFKLYLLIQISLNPNFSASAMRWSIRVTERNSPPRPTSAAKQLDEQWHTTFEKTGKYPNDPSFHTHIFSALAEIYRRNPQQSEALDGVRHG